MGRRLAISTLAATLIALLLLSALTGIIIYLSELQMGQPSTGAGTIEEAGEKIREKIDAGLWRYEAPVPGFYVFYVNATNTGQTTVKVVGAAYIMADGSLKMVPLDSSNFYYADMSPAGSQLMAMLAVRVIRAEYHGDPPQAMVLMTERGNMFYVMSFREALQFDFEVTVDPGSGSVQQGGSAAATVTVRLVSGFPQQVALSVSGLPSGASASFSQQSGLLTFTSSLTISTSTSTPTGTYAITITGTGGGISRSATYTLTVTTATYTVVFTQSGLPIGITWSVTFGTQTKSSTDLTITFTVPAGTYIWSASTPIPGGLNVRYAASPASGSINVPYQTSQLITYITQYQWAFSASGLSSDASGTIVVIDGANYGYSSLPVTFWWDSGSTHSYSYQQYVGSTASGKRYANHSPPSWSGAVTSFGSVNPSYHVEYQLTISVSPSGAGTTNPAPGSYWYDSGQPVSVSASPNAGYTLSYWLLDGANAGSSNPISVAMNAPHSLTAVFAPTYAINFYIYDDDGNAVSGATINFAGSSYSHGGSTSVTAGSYSLSTGTIPSGYRFLRWETSGSVSVASSTSTLTIATISGSGSITMRLQRVSTVTFSANGLSSDASGTVLTVDGSSYSYTDLPKSFIWDVGSSHSFTWADPVSAGSGKRYTWVSTSGLSTAKSGMITVPSGGGSVTASYKTQYQWIFSASGLSSDASGMVVTIDGTNYAYSNLPVTFWWDSGSTHIYSYQQYVSSTISGKRYANHSPPSWSGTITGSRSVSPSYHVEYQLTISVSPSGAGSVSLNPSSSDGYYDSGTSVTATATPNAGYVFSRWQMDGSDYSTSSSTTVAMNAPHSLTAVFTGATYQLTVYVYRSSTMTGIQGLTVKVDGTSYQTDSSGKVQVTVTYGSHTVEVVSPYYPSSGIRYVFTHWSDGSTSNPRTVSVTSDATLTAYVKLQYQLTVNVNPLGGGGVSTSPSSPDGYYDSGTSVTLTASSASGYAFDAWTGSATGTGSSTTVIMDGSKSVTANFFTFSISVSPTSGSTPSGGGVSATVTVTYVSGVNSKSISLSASWLPSGASASFNPSSVTISPSTTTATSTMTITTSTSTSTGTYTVTIFGSGGGVSKSTSYTLTVTTPVYTINFYIYSDDSNAVSDATINFAGSSYSHGDSISVASGTYSLSTGTIPSGYRFLRWETSGSVSVASSTSSSTAATISGSGSITMRLQRTATVTFSVNGMSLDASGTVLTVDGTNYAYSQLPVSFIWDVGSSHSFTWADPVSAGSGKRYTWVSTSGLSTAKSGMITVPSGGGSVTASYKTQYYLTVQASPSGGGSVSPLSGWRDAGSTVTISASPSSGWAFECWVGSGSGSYSGTFRSATVTMNSPITETAYFYTFSISVSPFSGSVSQGGSTTATVTVTLTGGYSSSVTVSLSASGLPSGASASFSPSSVTVRPTSRSDSSVMTIKTSYTFDFSLSANPSSLSVCRGASRTTMVTVSDYTSGTPTGTYSVSITGSGGGLSKSASYSLTVTSASKPSVSLSASTSASGLSFSFNPSSGIPPFTSTLTILASASASLGTQTVTVTGSGGGLTRITTVTVYVNDFSVSVNPTSAVLNIPLYGLMQASATVTLTAASGSGSSQTISLSVSGVPSGVTATFSLSSFTLSPGQSGTSTMTITVSPSASGGTYTLTITATSDGGSSRQVSYTLKLRTPILFYAQFWYKTQYYDVYLNPSGYWFGKNMLSVDSIPYAPEHFSTYYLSSYGSYALALWRDVGLTVNYEWYQTIYYDVSRAISGVDERYPWLSTGGDATSRIGSFTVPSRSGINPVIIRASYSRHIRLTVNKRPTPPSDSPGSISDTDFVEGTRLDGWYYDTASFTANPNFPYYQFDGSGTGEWHKDGDYSTVYSTSKTIYPRDPMILTADFYPRVRVQARDYENYALSNLGITVDGVVVYTDSGGYASRYVHPNMNIYVIVPSSASKTVTASGQGRYPDAQISLTGYFMKWQDGSISNSKTVYTNQPYDLTATYECGIYVYPGPIYGIYSVHSGFNDPVSPVFPRTYYFVGGSVRSWNNNPVSGVKMKITIKWRQKYTGIWYDLNLEGTSSSSTRTVKWGYNEVQGSTVIVHTGTSYYNTATWRMDLANQWNLDIQYYAYAWVDSAPTGYRFTGHSIPGAVDGVGLPTNDYTKWKAPLVTLEYHSEVGGVICTPEPYGFTLYLIYELI